jgi:opacity protein-like surface antigen
LSTALIISIMIYCSMSMSLTLNKHTMNAGGRLAFPMSIDRDNEFKLQLNIAPFFGIFLIDNLELRQKFELETVVLPSPKNRVRAPVLWGTSTVAIYYFDTSSRLFPYVGAGLGIKVMDWNLFSLNIAWEVPAGTLIELNENLALDIGLVIEGLMSLRSAAEKVSFTPAFFGFRYFF